MARRAIIPPSARKAAEQLKISPAVVSGDLVFLTGVTGEDSRGIMPEDPATPFQSVFEKIGSVLQETGLTFRSIVEMTSYHVGLRDHFDLFNAIRLEYVEELWPAWTAVEVAGLRREGALVEVRVIATIDPES